MRTSALARTCAPLFIWTKTEVAYRLTRGVRHIRQAVKHRAVLVMKLPLYFLIILTSFTVFTLEVEIAISFVSVVPRTTRGFSVRHRVGRCIVLVIHGKLIALSVVWTIRLPARRPPPTLPCGGDIWSHSGGSERIVEMTRACEHFIENICIQDMCSSSQTDVSPRT